MQFSNRRPAVWLLILALLSGITTAGCQLNRPQPAPTGSASQERRQLAKLLDIDPASSTADAQTSKPLPIWQNNAQSFALAASQTLSYVASGPFEAKVRGYIGYGTSFLRGQESGKCNGQSADANSQPTACADGRQVLIGLGYVANTAPKDRLKVVAYIAYAFGVGVVDAVATLSNSPETPKDVADNMARCVAGATFASLAKANKTGGNPADDTRKFVAAFANLSGVRGKGNTSSTQYGVNHPTVGACITRFYP